MIRKEETNLPLKNDMTLYVSNTKETTGILLGLMRELNMFSRYNTNIKTNYTVIYKQSKKFFKFTTAFIMASKTCKNTSNKRVKVSTESMENPSIIKI